MAMNNNNTVFWLAAGMAAVGIALGLLKTGVVIGSIKQDADIRTALIAVIDQYGPAYAKRIEQLLRWETRHFESEQWKQGNTAGMEAFSNVFPYGWKSLEEFAELYDLSKADFLTYKMVENNTGITKTFIRFPDAYTFILFLAWFIQNKRKGNFGNWYSMNEAMAENYEQQLDKVVPRIVNDLL